MIFDILTIFPNYFKSPLDESLLRKAMEKGILGIRIHDLRQFALDRHRMMDDYPYGGGRGMIMKPEPVIRAVEEIKKLGPFPGTRDRFPEIAGATQVATGGEAHD